MYTTVEVQCDTCIVAGIFDQGQKLVMQNVCVQVIMVTLLIALSSYEVYIQT